MISPEDYDFIADAIGEALEQGVGMSESLSDMLLLLQSNEALSGDFDKIQLRGVIEDTYLVIASEHKFITRNFLDVVGAMQDNVSTHHGPVNDFLADNGIKVRQSFAAISEQVGVTIDLANIE